MRADVYKRPNKPATLARKDRRGREVDEKAVKAPPPPVMVDRGTECHVTPPEVAARMADCLGPISGPILEPSAGTGNLVAALLDAGADPADVVAVERHGRLADHCRDRFGGRVAVYFEDFLEHAADDAGRFAGVLINPPFSEVRAHMRAALSALRPGGVLVALVPVTFDHPDAEEIERLSADTFSAARVHTKIIRIERT